MINTAYLNLFLILKTQGFIEILWLYYTLDNEKGCVLCVHLEKLTI